MQNQFAATGLEAPEPVEVGWSIEEASSLYHINTWGHPYFRINEAGEVIVRPLAGDEMEVAIVDIVREVRSRGVELPVLIRFQDILRRRVIELNERFRGAIEEFGYQGRYQGVYPIKVNQLHEVVLEILDAGEPYNFGIECGSKAELLAALPHLERDEQLLICNGYKDSTMLRMIVDGQQLGKNVIPIVEKYYEFEDFMAAAGAARHEKPCFGVRVRLSTSGSGKWAESGGDSSKFGVPVPQILQIVEALQSDEKLDAFRLIHFHIGSQIGDINTMKGAVREATRVYAKLRKMGIPIEYIDVGGGLGVNYDAIDSGLSQSINYTIQEYVNGIVYTIREVCDIEEVPHPTIVSESGRALTAHHSVLILGVLSSTKKDLPLPRPEISSSDEPVVRELGGLLGVLEKNMRAQDRGNRQRVARALELYHDAVEKRGEADQLFSLGYLDLVQKGKAETFYWMILQGLASELSRFERSSLPSDLYSLDEMLVDQYLCDFSLFQSMLDHWAIDQLFPIMPLHRLDTKPRRRGTLVDLTCDSDGKIDRFIGEDEEESFLPLHEIVEGEPYYLGCFLMGAYQDILGDMHNLFGRVNEVHVYGDADEEKNFYIETSIAGTSVTEALSLVQYSPADLRKRMEAIVRNRVRSGKLRPRRGVDLMDRYMAALKEYTYYNFRSNDQGSPEQKGENDG